MKSSISSTNNITCGLCATDYYQNQEVSNEVFIFFFAKYHPPINLKDNPSQSQGEKGDKGSPCRMPLEALMYPLDLQLRIME